jgi:crooked neck
MSSLYERLLARTEHVKVWMSYALSEGLEQLVQGRAIFQRGLDSLKKQGLKEERVMLLESWREFEREHGDVDGLALVKTKWPKRVRKRRKFENGQEEEFYDYLFPDEEVTRPGLKLLEQAHRWKQLQQQQQQSQSQPSS